MKVLSAFMLIVLFGAMMGKILDERPLHKHLNRRLSEEDYKNAIIAYIKRIVVHEWNSGVKFTDIENAANFSTAVEVEVNDTDVGVAFQFKVEEVDVKALDGPIFWDDEQDAMIGSNNFYRIRFESKKGGEFTTDLNVQLLDLTLDKHYYVKKFIRKSLLRYLSKLDQQVHDISSVKQDIIKLFEIQYQLDNYFFIPVPKPEVKSWLDLIVDKVKAVAETGYNMYYGIEAEKAAKIDREVFRVNCAEPKFDPINVMLSVEYQDENKVMINNIHLLIDSLYYQFEYSFNMTTKRVIIKAIENAFRKLQKAIFPFFSSWDQTNNQIIPGLIPHFNANAQMINEDVLSAIGAFIEVTEDRLPPPPEDGQEMENAFSPSFSMRLTVSNATDEDPDNKVIITRKFPKVSQYTVDLAPTFSTQDMTRMAERINHVTAASGMFTENFINPFIEAFMILDPGTTEALNGSIELDTIDGTIITNIITPPKSTAMLNNMFDLGLKNKLETQLGAVGQVGEDIIVDYFYQIKDPEWYEKLAAALGW